MHKNLSSFDRVVRAFLGAFFVFAAVALFSHPLARFLAAAFGCFSLWEMVAGKCPLAARLGQAAPGGMPSGMGDLLALAGVQAVVAYEWWSAGLGKVSSPDFVNGIGKTLAAFASKNPFPWYKAFLEGFATRNAAAFAYAVEWGQVAVAVALTASVAALLLARDRSWFRRLSVVTIAALFGGMLMSANFYLAAGWTGAGTKGVNVVMFWVQAMLLHAWARRARRAE